VDLSQTPRALRDLLGAPDQFRARFELPVDEGVLHLGRTHPVVEGLATYVLDAALDDGDGSVARRAGVIRTEAVHARTTLLLCRFRFDITTARAGIETNQLAEEMGLVAFAGAPDAARWLDPDAAEAVLDARPSGNIAADRARGFVATAVEGLSALRSQLERDAARRAEALLDAHRRVRQAARERGLSYRVTARLPVDVLGVYVYLPVT
jgi:hypothetical protein